MERKKKSFCGSNNNKHKGKGGSQASQVFIRNIINGCKRISFYVFLGSKHYGMIFHQHNYWVLNNFLLITRKPFVMVHMGGIS